MMHVLIESGATPRRRGARWTFTSVAVHAAIVTLAIVATSEATTPAAIEPVRQDTVVFIVPATPATPATITPRPAAPSGIRVPQRPQFHLPTDIRLPAIPTFDARRSFATDASLLISGPGIAADSGVRVSGMRNGLHTSASVDRAVLAHPTNPRPEYPQSLRTAGLEGDVLVTFVVDSAGRVEPGSIRIVQASHAQFAESVRRWLPRTRYRPAEAGGIRVRQYVQQQIGFALEKGR